jgi:hypothetical protein
MFKLADLVAVAELFFIAASYASSPLKLKSFTVI